MAKKDFSRGVIEPLPERVRGFTQSFLIDDYKFYIGTSEYSDGRPAQVLFDTNYEQDNGVLRQALQLFARSMSTGLQAGVPLDKLYDGFLEDERKTQEGVNLTYVIERFYGILSDAYLEKSPVPRHIAKILQFPPQ